MLYDVCDVTLAPVSLHLGMPSFAYSEQSPLCTGYTGHVDLMDI